MAFQTEDDHGMIITSSSGLAWAADTHSVVMPGLDPGIHRSSKESWRRGWIAGSSSAKTHFALLPGNDELQISP
jgi:hypothetical protein